MKKIIALALLLSVICTPMCAINGAINAHGAEDPCGKGCPLTERYVLDLSEETEYVIIVYMYPCGGKGERYVEGVLEGYSIHNSSEDFIRQYFRQSDGSFQYCPVPVPVRHDILTAPKTKK